MILVKHTTTLKYLVALIPSWGIETLLTIRLFISGDCSQTWTRWGTLSDRAHILINTLWRIPAHVTIVSSYWQLIRKLDTLVVHVLKKIAWTAYYVSDATRIGCLSVQHSASRSCCTNFILLSVFHIVINTFLAHLMLHLLRLLSPSLLWTWGFLFRLLWYDFLKLI
jgi:hypothetical protein